ncbi:uncharacterized protein B0H18DRAFT_30908 [Fomitopsis serialis]|uniref:uncharacterized protein n=1 Tax=Fomitopsis serialis TaxID=139415 RepID=UPI002008258F|nr:uncharacterized protein B0H18DRAFT_30908 [Neoantrodia serialis]KAH9932584.1 hypothetical protein B0H18DRAFT_30908 [Neoantrodia serialis]
MYRDYAVTPQSSDSSLADSLQTLRVSPDPNSEEDDAPIQTLPSLSEEDRLRVQGSSPSEIREWALSEASLFPFGLYAYRLRALSNSTLPVNRLPPEILFKIFEFFRQDSLCSGSRWVAKVMGVCRYWREILVSSPLAWSIIDLRDTIHFIQLCLSRSEDVDLHVAFYHPVSESCLFAIDAPSIPNEFAQHLHRISRLELSSDSLLGLNRTPSYRCWTVRCHG